MKVVCRSCGLVQPPTSWCRRCSSLDLEPISEMEAMTARIVVEAIVELRQRAAENEVVSRAYRVCEEAVAARRALLDSPEMPAVGYDAQTRRVHA